VLIFALSPVVVSASIWFSTEGPLYLATSAMLYYLFVTWTERSEKSRSWIGLELAIGLGLLSKASFVAISFDGVLVCCKSRRTIRHSKLSVAAKGSVARIGGCNAMVVAEHQASDRCGGASKRLRRKFSWPSVDRDLGAVAQHRLPCRWGIEN
jgi:hypothetical protein